MPTLLLAGGGDEALLPVRDGGLWGFANASGEVVVPARYEAIAPHFQGLARVRLNGKWGYLDRRGKMAIDPSFTSAGDFHEGRARVLNDASGSSGAGGSSWSYIDLTGSIVAGGFLSATDFADGYALVQREADGTDPVHLLIDRAGRVVSEASDGFFKVTGPPHDGLLPTFVYGRGFGYTDATGRFAIEPRAEMVDARGFSEGRGAVRVGELWGFVDVSGRLVVEPAYSAVGNFAGGHAAVRVDGGWTFVGADGTRLSGAYEEVGAFSEGRGAVRVDGRWGFIDASGAMVIEPAFDGVGFVGELGASFRDGACLVRRGNDAVYLALDGSELFTFSLE